VTAVIKTAHVPLRPAFDCANCGEPWPCVPAKVELTGEYQGDVIGLGQYLSLQLVDAMDQAALNHEWGPVGNLYDRFLGWMRQDQEDRSAA
jgi:hypothetical protein